MNDSARRLGADELGDLGPVKTPTSD